MVIGAQRIVVDLSVPLISDMPVYRGDPEVFIQPALRVARGDGVNVLSVHLATHSGTHVDAPHHIRDEWPRLDELPLERFIGVPVVADLRDLAPNAAITPDRLRDALTQSQPGDILVLHTGWSRFWADDRYRSHPWLEAEAARAIIVAGVRTVGIDALSVDPTPEDATEARLDAHEVILGVGGVIIENLTGLDALETMMDPLLFCVPLSLSGADGSPVRAIATELGAETRPTVQR
jgi:kynurenine formamidase